MRNYAWLRTVLPLGISWGSPCTDRGIRINTSALLPLLNSFPVPYPASSMMMRSRRRISRLGWRGTSRKKCFRMGGEEWDPIEYVQSCFIVCLVLALVFVLLIYIYIIISYRNFESSAMGVRFLPALRYDTRATLKYPTPVAIVSPLRQYSTCWLVSFQLSPLLSIVFCIISIRARAARYSTITSDAGRHNGELDAQISRGLTPLPCQNSKSSLESPQNADGACHTEQSLSSLSGNKTLITVLKGIESR